MQIAVFHDLPSGGAKRAVYEIVRRLARQHMVGVYSTSSADHDFCDLRPHVHSHHIAEFTPLPLFQSPLGRLNQIQRWRSVSRLESVSRRIAAQINDARPDVVFVHPSTWTQAPSVLHYLNRPAIYYVHEPFRRMYEPPISRPYMNRGWRAALDSVDALLVMHDLRLRWLDRRNTSRAQHLLTNSHFTARNVRLIYGREAGVCYLGVDSKVFRRIAGQKRGSFVLSVGALRADKGFDFLIESLARLDPACRPPLRIVANADHPAERRFLMDLAEARNVRLEIEIAVSEELLINRYNQAALVVYAPVREPFGFVPLEAMACGVPVVGVNEGGVAETVAVGVTGILAPRDPSLFGRAIADLLGDDSRRLQMASNGPEHVAARWTWEATTASVTGIFAGQLGLT